MNPADAFQRAIASMQVFWPRLNQFYETILSGVLSRDSTLERNFPKNVFACATLNLGPCTVTAEHYDHLNIPFGMCAVTAFGTYNPKTSGQIVLHNLKLIVEFPPASTIQLPSAIVRHSNLGIAKDEARYSFTQYTSGSLFRWWECGFRMFKSFVALGMEFTRSGRERWEWGVGLLGKWEEIKHTFTMSAS